MNESTFDVELKAPTYEAAEWDEYDEDWYEDIENEMFIMWEESQTGDITNDDGTVDTISHHVWIDTWLNKEYTRPDVLEVTFNGEGTTNHLADGKIIFSYLQFNPTSDTSGTK